MGQEMALSELAPGETARVQALLPGCAVGDRLGELGIRPGTRLRCLRRAPAGDPTAYGVLGMVLALRRRDAAQIRVERGEGQ